MLNKKASHHPDPIATHLCLGTVSVPIVHKPGCSTLLVQKVLYFAGFGWPNYYQAICPNAKVSIAKLLYFQFREIQLSNLVKNQNEVVTGAVALGEVDGHHYSLITSMATPSKSLEESSQTIRLSLLNQVICFLA